MSAAAAVALVAGAATAAVAVMGSPGGSVAGPDRTLSSLAATRSVTAVANVTPPVAAGSCARPTAFSYSGTLSAAAPGAVTYRWIYSSGRSGPVQSVRFARPGQKLVLGQTVAAGHAGGGWAELSVISPVARASNKAAYQLLCGGTAGGISVTATVTPATRTAQCAPAGPDFTAPDFTAAGAIRVAKAATVAYYWAQSNGRKSALATLTFRRAGVQPVRPLIIAPPAVSGTAEAVLVVTRPVAAASLPAVYTLNCQASVAPAGGGPPTAPGSSPPTAPATAPAGHSSPPSPARTTGPSSPSSPPGSTPPASYLNIDDCGNIAVTVGDTASCTVTVSNGTAPYTWSAAGLPPGLVASPSGSSLEISGVTTAAGDFIVTVTVSDSSSPPITETPEIVIYVGLPSMTVTVDAPSTATFGQPYSGTVTVTGGDGTYTWATTNVLPGLTLTPDGGTLIISGAPAEDGTGPLITGTVTDAEATPQSLNWVVDLTIKAPQSSSSAAARPAPPSVSPAKLR